MENGVQQGGGAWGRVARIALAVSVVALAAEFVAGEGTRLGWWHFRAGFGVLGRAAWAGLAGAIVSAVALAATWKRGEKGRAAMSGVGLVLGLLAVAIPGTFYLTAKHVPMIHDISTDTVDPPAFVALLETRKASPNGADYGGPEVAEKQRAAYPDIKPIKRDLPPAAAFERALAAARSLGWKIAEANAAEGRIEATDTTRWFGFKDDVVIRVRPGPSGAGSRVDVRSVSRVGKSDIGKNAARIRAFVNSFAQ
jgi:uncharacterized protein (DUF1499 family)